MIILWFMLIYDCFLNTEDTDETDLHRYCHLFLGSLIPDPGSCISDLASCIPYPGSRILHLASPVKLSKKVPSPLSLFELFPINVKNQMEKYENHQSIRNWAEDDRPR